MIMKLKRLLTAIVSVVLLSSYAYAITYAVNRVLEAWLRGG